jgi:hypothetical protein
MAQETCVAEFSMMYVKKCNLNTLFFDLLCDTEVGYWKHFSSVTWYIVKHCQCKVLGRPSIDNARQLSQISFFDSESYFSKLLLGFFGGMAQ